MSCQKAKTEMRSICTCITQSPCETHIALQRLGRGGKIMRLRIAIYPYRWRPTLRSPALFLTYRWITMLENLETCVRGWLFVDGMGKMSPTSSDVTIWICPGKAEEREGRCHRVAGVSPISPSVHLTLFSKCPAVMENQRHIHHLGWTSIPPRDGSRPPLVALLSMVCELSNMPLRLAIVSRLFLVSGYPSIV